MYPNSLQIFHLCCIHGYEREKSKPCFHTLFEVKRTINYYLKMLEIIKKIIVNLITVVQNYYHLLVKDKYVVGIFFNI
jgi:hypothetical protein